MGCAVPLDGKVGHRDAEGKMKISKKWMAMAEIYKRFAIEYPQADFSDAAALAMYEHETHGKPLERTEKLNGFALGKKWMDVTIAGWKDEIASRGLLVSELIADGYPEWFLERIGVLHLRAEWSKCEWWMKVSNAEIRG